MLSLITKGENKGIVIDLCSVKRCIYTDGQQEYTTSDFVPLDLIEHQLEENKLQIEELAETNKVLENYLCLKKI